MARQLNGTVLVHHDGEAHFYRPGDDIPPDIASEIREDLWVDDGEDDQADGGSGDSPTPPPKGGPGSGAEAWAQYARELAVDIEAGASRDDIIAAIDAAGYPVD